MSQINEIKKKTKISLDEMYDNQAVGLVENQKENKTENLKSLEDLKRATEDLVGATDQPEPVSTQSYAQKATPQNILQLVNEGEQREGPQETQKFTPIPSKKEPLQKIPTCKMTFNLTEGAYKAFNDIYAKRMLQGRKTEKSELICEAIDWLLKMENS